MREILCNSIVHKDYRGVHTQMKVYDDHIRLWNEGVLIDEMTIESLRQEHNSCPRNKLIAQVFYLAGFIETWGRGIQKVDDAFIAAGLSVPEYEESCGGIVTLIPRAAKDNNDPKDDPKDDPKQLSERQLFILRCIREKSSVTREELTQKMKVSEATVKRELLYLQNKGFIVRVGGRKDGHWQIVSD